MLAVFFRFQGDRKEAHPESITTERVHDNQTLQVNEIGSDPVQNNKNRPGIDEDSKKECAMDTFGGLIPTLMKSSGFISGSSIASLSSRI